MRVAVLGAGGIIAPAIVRDLAESAEFEDLTLLDLDGTAARAAAAQYGDGKATGAAVDALDRQGLTLALEGHQVLINAASYRVNLAAMDAALAAGCNYIDLGGLYHVTKQQMAMAPAFESAGLVAILGCGAGPGKTNLMAVLGARALGRSGRDPLCVGGLRRGPARWPRDPLRAGHPARRADDGADRRPRR